MTVKALIHGLTAGAAGTAVLNTVTYLDMVIRDRPSSNVPAKTAERATDLLDITLATEETGNNDAHGQNRKQGVGALLGYVTGFGVGAVYGMLRPRALSGLPIWLTGIGIAGAATVATVVPYGALGVSDPRKWSATSWASDIIPHLAFGWTTAATFEALDRP